jgi:hypothetical protein
VGTGRFRSRLALAETYFKHNLELRFHISLSFVLCDSYSDSVTVHTFHSNVLYSSKSFNLDSFNTFGTRFCNFNTNAAPNKHIIRPPNKDRSNNQYTPLKQQYASSDECLIAQAIFAMGLPLFVTPKDGERSWTAEGGESCKSFVDT